MTFSMPDFIILGLIFLSILIGIVRGFVKESISLVTWIVAIYLAVMYANSLSIHMTFTSKPFLKMLTAFLLIFVGIVFVGALINYMIGMFIRNTSFSAPDRILGSVFGLLRGIVFVTILVLLGGLTPLTEAPWWQQSYGVTQFQELALWLKDRLPEEYAKVFHFPVEKQEGVAEKKTIRSDG